VPFDNDDSRDDILREVSRESGKINVKDSRARSIYESYAFVEAGYWIAIGVKTSSSNNRRGPRVAFITLITFSTRSTFSTGITLCSGLTRRPLAATSTRSVFQQTFDDLGQDLCTGQQVAADAIVDARYIVRVILVGVGWWIGLVLEFVADV